jgi:predicted transcriptional regulator
MADAESLKPAAHELVDRLPDDASWEDLMYQIYVRAAIDAGLQDADAGRLVPHEEAVRRLRRPAS